ncbi:hypothetical protein BOTBODRAFT_622525 [Botryobasidium botryosum FD-172 SS1]|uniref:Elongator complex protein 1 n=1 Tax=Botryobasidium botryosum (strain FD-172 SS1) TaxID=930990 RepID=A0A067LTI9_BOTB1|nr:hypothetical protein BOTBODRAFT_622525 [Botryobasidium botryosum FD-172 SS1]
MRNLSIESAVVSGLPASARENAPRITSCAVDADTNALYIVVERASADRGICVEIWKTAESNATDLQGPLASLETSENVLHDASTSTSSRVVSARVLPEARSICVIINYGDIAMLSLEPGASPEFDIVGTIESGIKAASWAPDDSKVAVVTGNDDLLLMSADFTVLSEAPIHIYEFGEDQSVNVGWGSKSTQFHGSAGKNAAAADVALSAVGVSPDDDKIPRVSWRGDGAFFSVSTLSLGAHQAASTHRVIRVYTNLGVLQSTSEPIHGLEHTLSWKPSGALIASTQRFLEGRGKEGRHDVVFFERNGLRHGEFGLRLWDPSDKSVESSGGRNGKWGYRIKELAWNADSLVLAVWVEKDAEDVIQLWTTGNYHWYLKQEIFPLMTASGTSRRFTAMLWHPEDALRLVISTPVTLEDYRYCWETYNSHTSVASTNGTVAVVDGASVHLTPFRLQNIPPPMFSYKIDFPSAPSSEMAVPIHVSFASGADVLAALYHKARVILWSLGTRGEGVGGKIAKPSLMWDGICSQVVRAKQVSLWIGSGGNAWRIAVLGKRSDSEYEVVEIIQMHEGSTGSNVLDLPISQKSRLVKSEGDGIFLVDDNGQLVRLRVDDGLVQPTSSFPEYCFSVQSTALGIQPIDKRLYFGLAASGKLYASDDSLSATTLSTSVNSFVLTPSYLIFVTNSHDAFFVLLLSIPMLISSAKASTAALVETWEKRRVERGSRIVVAVPSAMSLVLQMPRGNLETINPRPLVLEIVKQDVDMGNYRKAFLACRKHRIDLNILVDHDPEAFMRRLPDFVEQIHEVDYINLFLSGVGRSSQPPEKICQFCDAIRKQLEDKDLKKYVNSILTAHAVKSPPDHEAGLSLLLQLKETERDLVEDAVKYIIFLVDADSLFNTALGMYDFSLVVMIAQHAQKDPREYLPFLKELRAMDPAYQRFRINDHLKRYLKALESLRLGGSARYEEAKKYVEKHGLYADALRLWKSSKAEHEGFLELYGDFLFDRRDFKQAALAFSVAGRKRKAMVAYERAHAWRELFSLALSLPRAEFHQDELKGMAYRVSDDLRSRKRYGEAARVLLDYAQDLPEAVIAYARGNEISEALRIMSTHPSKTEDLDLLESIIKPIALELREEIAEDIKEAHEQFVKQRNRLIELAEVKAKDPETFYTEQDAAEMYNIDVMTDAGASTAVTTFTRYTAAPSASSQRSKQTSRSKRKQERKRGRKGTVDEQEYILQSIAKLVARLETMRTECQHLLPHLVVFSAEHQEAGKALQHELRSFEEALIEGVDAIWKSTGGENEGREGERSSGKLIQRPDMPKATWAIGLMELDV